LIGALIDTCVLAVATEVVKAAFALTEEGRAAKEDVASCQGQKRQKGEEHDGDH